LTLAAAERLLKLLPGYTAADVERAYRRRALLCHPDKVSHLDEDFQTLAAQKFKRLQEARDLLAGG
jgi:DnaJ like chaperone protein